MQLIERRQGRLIRRLLAKRFACQLSPGAPFEWVVPTGSALARRARIPDMLGLVPPRERGSEESREHQAPGMALPIRVDEDDATGADSVGGRCSR